MSALCSTLCCVPEPNPDGVPARDPDRLNKWFIGFVVMGVGVSLLSGFVVAQKWAWLPPAAFIAALLVLCRVLVFCGVSVMAQRGLGAWLCSR
jgi:hypothetical protein